MSGGGEKGPKEESIEEWLSSKLEFDLDDVDSDGGGTPVSDPAPRQQGSAAGSDEPSVPIPWPDWEPEPFPTLGKEGAHAEPARPCRTTEQRETPLISSPWERRNELPRWADGDEREETSALLLEGPASRTAKTGRPTTVPIPSGTESAQPGASVTGPATARRRNARPAQTRGGAPRPVTAPTPRRREGHVPVPTSWEEQPHVARQTDPDPELSFAGRDVNEPEIVDLENQTRRALDIAPLSRNASRAKRGARQRSTASRPEPLSNSLPPMLLPAGGADEHTMIHGFDSPEAPDAFLFDQQPTVILRPDSKQLVAARSVPIEPGRSDPYRATVMAWTGASAGIVLFGLVLAVAALAMLRYVGLFSF